MKFKDLIVKNRSVRGYDRSRTVYREEMLEMIDCARLSASSMSVQPLKYYMTENMKEADIVTSHAKFAGALPELGLPLENTAPPAYILVCHDKRIWADPKRFYKDVGIVAQSMSLCAVEMGLNCLMMGAFNGEKIREELNIAEYQEIVLVLAVGKSIENIKITEAKPPKPPIDSYTLEKVYKGDYEKYAEKHPEELKNYRKEDLKAVQYYRDDDVHYVPKRKIEDVLAHKKWQ